MTNIGCIHTIDLEELIDYRSWPIQARQRNMTNPTANCIKRHAAKYFYASRPQKASDSSFPSVRPLPLWQHYSRHQQHHLLVLYSGEYGKEMQGSLLLFLSTVCLMLYWMQIGAVQRCLHENEIKLNSRTWVQSDLQLQHLECRLVWSDWKLTTCATERPKLTLNKAVYSEMTTRHYGMKAGFCNDVKPVEFPPWLQ